jgi:hypothetical protein
MFRNLLPFILASLAATLFAWSINMPLLEWQTSNIVTDPPYDIRFAPSPWVAKFGDSLENSSFVSNQFDSSYCGESFHPEKMKSVVNRLWSEELLERITRNVNHSIIPWLWFLILLSGFYIWWYSIHYKRPIIETFLFTAFAIILLCILLDISRPFFAIIGGPGCLEGTVIFNARLSKIHYETLLVFLTAITTEIGAASMMVRQLSRAIKERK